MFAYGTFSIVGLKDLLPGKPFPYLCSMNRNRLRPLASLLVLCFLLVSVLSRSATNTSDANSFHTFYSQKSEAGIKRIIQVIIEEKEGEKGSEKQSGSTPIFHSLKLNSTCYSADICIKVFASWQLSGVASLYLTNRSLRI